MAKKRFLLRALVLFVFVLVCPLSAEGLPPIEIHFVDVGQGDAILIKGPEGANILIDTGNLSAGWKVRKYLQEQGVYRLRAIVITHMHPDHVGGLFALMPDIEVQKIYDNGAVLSGNEFWHEYVNFVQDLGVKRVILRAGDNLSFGDFTAQVLSPRETLSGNLNTDSIVIKACYGAICALLMADANKKVERRLMAVKGFDLASQVLKVGHHGACDAISEAFLTKVVPQIVVISVGESNRYGYPCAESLDRILKQRIKLLRTDIHGTIVITTDGKTFKVSYDKK